MKKIMTLAVCGILLLTSCVKGFDEVGPEPTPDPTPTPTPTNNKATQEEIDANVVRSSERHLVLTRIGAQPRSILFLLQLMLQWKTLLKFRF